MKLLRISIFSFLAALTFWSANAKAQPLSVQLGIYDFTDNVASEFYHVAPTILVGYDVWKSSLLSSHISTGLSFTQIKYNNHYHYLYMMPLLVTVNYDIPNPDSRVRPVFGMGLSLLGKADQNKDLVKTYHSLLYGYHATGGLRFQQKNNIVLTVDLTYNLLIPPTLEDVNMNGVIITFGVRIPMKLKKN
jgi:hypothetical protein